MAVVIGHDFVRHHPSALDRLAKERLRTGRAAALTEQDVDDHAVLVDRTVQVALVPLAEQEHLIHEPLTADLAPTTADLGGQLWPKGLDPVQYCAVRNINAALSQ